MDDLKLPPFSVEAEQSVLGGLIIDNSALDKIELEQKDFYRRDHGIIFKTIQDLDANNQPFDIITLGERLDEGGVMEHPLSYLGALAKNTPTSANIKAYAKIVKDKSTKRKMITIGHNIASSGYDNDATAEEVIDLAQSSVMGLTTLEDKMLDMNGLLVKMIDDLDERYQNGGQIVGLETQFDYLNKLTNGLNKSDLIIVAGRPSMGKTTFAMNIAEHQALKNKSVLKFSMEMSAQQLVERSTCSIGGVDFDRFRKGQLTDDEWPKITSVVGLLNKSKLLIDDRAALAINQVRSKARQVKKRHGLDLIVIDYLQLMKCQGNNRNEGISEVSRGLKSLAKELDVPVIAISQLNRTLENRPNKRPQMADLRDSGAIEQDADVIIFLYRDEVYDENTPNVGIAEAIIRKQRNGKLGTCYLQSELDQCRFKTFTGQLPEKQKSFADTYRKSA